MALCALGQAILPDIAQRVHRVAPVGQLVVEFDAVAIDRAIDLRFGSGAVVLGAAARLGAQAIGFVDDERDQLRHPLERRRLVGRQGGECEKVLQKGALQGQRILAAGLQVEDVDLVTGGELQ